MEKEPDVKEINLLTEALSTDDTAEEIINALQDACPEYYDQFQILKYKIGFDKFCLGQALPKKLSKKKQEMIKFIDYNTYYKQYIKRVEPIEKVGKKILVHSF